MTSGRETSRVELRAGANAIGPVRAATGSTQPGRRVASPRVPGYDVAIFVDREPDSILRPYVVLESKAPRTHKARDIHALFAQLTRYLSENHQEETK